LLAILVVARALLDPATQPPRITAVLAGTVAAIYEHLLTMVAVEMDEGEEPICRPMLLDALDERNSRCDQEPLALPSPACQDLEEWWEVIESLRDTVLEDHDFDMESVILDAPPRGSSSTQG
jgi:hypothetical protein